MIKNIFWDIDECLMHTSFNADFEGHHFMFTLDGDRHKYHTKVRPAAASLIEYSRELLGHENVYILTASTRDYASKISELAGWNFDDSHILTRETLQQHEYPLAYGSRTTLPHATLSHAHNVLIDNLHPRHNIEKMRLIGIDSSRYHHVQAYYGITYPDCTFEKDVKHFLNTLHNEEY
jgi:hypothetical protein